MSRASPGRTLLFALVTAACTAVLMPACLDFNRAYGSFCDRTGACDAGTNPDAGDGSCRPFGADCDGPAQCCASDDAGPLGCSSLGYCQATRRRCLSDGYACSTNDECCTGVCDGQRCRNCRRDGEPCTSYSECCVNEGYLCTQGGTCEYVTGALNDHCGNPDDCSSDYCEVVPASTPIDGTCMDPPLGCAPAGTVPSGIQACCPGSVIDAGPATCCVPSESPCDNDSTCCSGNCIAGNCTTAPDTVPGDFCQSTSGCSGQMGCDRVSASCQTRWCFPRTSPRPGCCTFTFDSDTCTFQDGSTCTIGWGLPCSSPGECCSGTCNGNTCALPFF